MWSAISLRARMSSGRMPRTSAPAAPPAAGRHDLALDQRGDAGDTRECRGPCAAAASKSVKRAGLAIDREMAVEAEDAADQIGAKPVHHRHHDDQRRHPERDPEQRKDRDDRDKPLLPPRPQIAERDHPLEGTEDHAAAVSRSGEGGRAQPAVG